MPTRSWIEVPIEQEIGDVPTTGYAPYFFPIEGGTALFKFTEAEFTQVLSALINGAALTYPNEWIQVVWYFLRSVEFPVAICEQIISCVTSDVDTQNAIASMLSTNDIFNQYLTTTVRGITGGGVSGKLISGECDNGIVAGKVKAIVDAMDQANKDWFERIEVGTNDEEKFALALEAIPIIGELPFDQVIEFGEDILEDFTENYNAQVDAELLNEWYCGLYCKAKSKPDCSLSYGDIYAYFSERTGSGLSPFSALSDVVGFIRTGDFSGGTKVADGMMMLQAGLVVNGREFLGSSLPTLGFATRDAGTASFWEECEECPEDELWLTPVLGDHPDSIELISGNEDPQTWEMKNYVTGHYLTGGAYAADASAFYILSVEVDGDTGDKARMVTDFGTFALDEIPCEFPTTKMWLYEVGPEAVVTVTISREGCADKWGIEYYGEIVSQSATSVTGRGILSGDSGGLYQLELKVLEGACLIVTGGDATTSTFEYNYYVPCNEDAVELPMVGSTIPPIVDAVSMVAFSSPVPFDVTLEYEDV